MKNAWLILSLAFAMALAGACGDGDAGTGDGIEIAGSWMNDFDGDETITSQTWTSPLGDSPIISFDNQDNHAIVQNPDDADFDPGKYNHVVWTEITDDVFYYCYIDLGLETAKEAEDTSLMADEDDLEEGCLGFPWTMNTRAED